MCLATPMKVIQLDGADGVVEAGGIRQGASFLMLEGARVGDYVIVHAGYAIQKLDEKEALETLELLKEFIESAPPE